MGESRSAAGGGEPEFVRCRLCRRPFRRVTGTHLYWKHGLETQDYRDRFPDAPFFAEENKRELALAVINAWERLGRHWTRDRVRTAVRSLQKQGRPLHAHAVKTSRSDVFGASLRLYGSWDRALSDAGIAPGSVRRRRVWRGEDLIAAIKGASRAGLFRSGAKFRGSHSGLVQAASHRWGSWRAALEAAGIDPLRPAPVRWTRREVVRRIRGRAGRGLSLLASEVHSHAPALRQAAERLFGKPWRDLIRHLGYPYEGRERWSPERIVKELGALKRSGRNVNCQAVRRHDLPLAQAAARYFGTWDKALRAAGLDPAATKLRHWSKQDLRRLFRRLRRSGGLTRNTLRQVRRPGFVQATTSIPMHWVNLDAAFRDQV